MRRILLVGLGRSNKEVVKKLKQNTLFYIYADSYNEEDMAFIQSNKLTIFDLNQDISSIDMVVKVPGIPLTHPLIVQAKAKKVKVVTEIDIAYDLAPKSRYIVITGSNGKSTTTMLIFKALSEKYPDVRLAGNIGLPLINEIDGASESTIFVLELSSYQLETMENLKPEVVVMTNLISTHLEYHGSYNKYVKAKLKSMKNNPKLVIIPDDDSNINKEYHKISQLTEKLVVVDKNLLDCTKFPLKGDHNKLNYAFAYTVTKYFKLSKTDFKRAMMQYGGLEHRMELVKSKPITIINDSKSTNIESTLRALSAFESGVVIIGGQFISQNYSILKRYQNYIFITYQDITLEILDTGTYFESFQHAVYYAHKTALELGIPLILSPACPSFGQFRNFEERGRKFKQIIEEK